MVGISKHFHTTRANHNVSFSIESGEIVGLLGENGAGKTTLMNILYSLIQADQGEIRINGETVRLHSPRDAIRRGIGMVHQHFMLVENHTVAENIALGFEGAPFFYPARYVAKKIEDFSRRYGLKVNTQEKIWQLSAGEQQRVEIVMALLRGADLLILDEPTSVLTPQESEELFSILRRMSGEGHSVVFISHKLEEILSICDRVLVLRNGEVVGASSVEDIDKRKLARMMVGRDIIFNLEKEHIERGPLILEVKGLTVPGDRIEKAVKGVSFKIYQNEIFGIAGVSGNGQHELIEAITGLRKASGGSILINGKEIINTSARAVCNQGISHVPEERIKFGIVPNLSIYENAVLKKHHNKRFAKTLFLNYQSIKSHAEGIIRDFRITTPSINTPVKNLSGGNIQKLILGREISDEPSLLVAAHPTYGLDVSATEYIRTQLLKRRGKGVAVLLVSEDLEEIFELSDRIAVMFEGEIMGILTARTANIEEIGLMMTGSRV